MIQRTTNLSKRAEDIADRDANAVWNETHDWDLMVQTWLTTYKSALLEFSWTV